MEVSLKILRIFALSHRRHKTSINEQKISPRSINFFLLSRKSRKIFPFSFWQSKCHVIFRPYFSSEQLKVIQSQRPRSFGDEWLYLTLRIFSAETHKQQLLRKTIISSMVVLEKFECYFPSIEWYLHSNTHHAIAGGKIQWGWTGARQNAIIV